MTSSISTFTHFADNRFVYATLSTMNKTSQAGHANMIVPGVNKTLFQTNTLTARHVAGQTFVTQRFSCWHTPNAVIEIRYENVTSKCVDNVMRFKLNREQAKNTGSGSQMKMYLLDASSTAFVAFNDLRFE